MRIDQLKLTAFGPFTDCTINLQPGLNVIFGPNEAGKSSMLRAIQALLFGVPARSVDNFVHAYRQLRVGGVLVKEDGERLECVRRKGNKATLRDQEDDNQLDESVLQGFLGAVDENFFSSVFGIDHERLREGGDEIIRGEGRIGELLFAAGGVSHLRGLQQKLAGEAADLFKPNAQKPHINSALSNLKQLRAEIRDLQASSEDWANHETQRKQQQALADKTRRELSDAEAAKERLQRIMSAWPTLSMWKGRRRDLDSLETAVLLPEDAEKRRSEAIQQLSLAQSALQQAKDQVESLAKKLDALQVPDVLLEKQNKIDALYMSLGSHETGVKDRRTLKAKMQSAKNNARQTLDRLGWSTKLDEVGKQRLPDEKKTLVRTLAKRHDVLLQRVMNAEKKDKQSIRQLQELKQQLADAPDPVEERALVKALANAAGTVELAEGLESRRVALQSLQQSTKHALARLPIWNGTLDELRLLKVPLEATVDQFDQLCREITTSLTNLQGRLRENTSDIEQRQEKMAAIEAGDSVPTEQELSDARSLRDRGVQLAVQTLDGNTPSPEDVSDFVRQLPSGDVLSSSLEPVVRQADLIADRLRREAERVAEKSQLVAQLETLEGLAVRLSESIAAADTEKLEQKDQWEQCWHEADITPLSPAEMRAWLRQHSELLRSASELATTADALDADCSRCDSLRSALLNETECCGIQGDLLGESFSSLIAAGQDHVDGVRHQRARLDQLISDIERANLSADEATVELQTAVGKLAEWRITWTGAIEPLQLPADALPEQAESVLTNLEQLLREYDEAEGYGRRIWGIDKTAEEFVESAEGLAETIAADLAGQEIDTLVKTLNSRVGEARRDDQQRKSLLEQIEQQESLAQEAESSHVEAEAALEGLMAEANCSRDGELAQAIERSNRKRELQSQVAELEEQLAPYHARQTLGDFLKDAETEDLDCLPSKISESDERIAQLGSQRDEAITAAERAANELKQYDGNEAAATKADEQQCLLSQLEQHVRDYLVTSTADALLSRAVERYQQRAQGPVLKIAGARFSLLTQGAFIGLRSDLDESGNDVLVGVRPDGRSTLRVEGMSEGARDQLYLALRLSTLEHWFDQHEPVPFVVDDVLLSFDDSRADATIQVLLDLSKRTQVIFFTHHDHLVTLARNVSEREGLKTSLNIVTDWGDECGP